MSCPRMRWLCLYDHVLEKRYRRPKNVIKTCVDIFYNFLLSMCILVSLVKHSRACPVLGWVSPSRTCNPFAPVWREHRLVQSIPFKQSTYFVCQKERPYRHESVKMCLVKDRVNDKYKNNANIGVKLHGSICPVTTCCT